MTYIDEHGTNMILTQIHDILTNLGLDKEQVSKVTSQLSFPFPRASGKLATDYRRKQFYKLPGYVPSKEIKMGIGADGKKRVFHLVPIDASLTAMLSDKAISSAIIEDIQKRASEHNKNIYEDFYNGSVFQNNHFFKDNPDALVSILYQDEFEVVCPIGAAKNKYKILAVYYSVGNLPPHLRSDPKNIQLVALCRKKYFNAEKVFGAIVEDFLKIEKYGVEVSPNVFRKAGVVFISGDNLGSHSLGGYVENFSRSIFFCRYCLIERKDLNNFRAQTNGEEEEIEEMEEEVTDLLDLSDTDGSEAEVSVCQDNGDEDIESGDDESESEAEDNDEETVE
ncbi:DNA-directed RNA polymerases I and III subunit RPAC2 [Frankliniella fusca]|uniref:DNA-directed RNA polymerases I and III subunit RPAC2 n=1 Tax=Frankliniella fusca TaxID=407009 RepID=A0AAE1GX85_9NEOP|nr:DNA-directed RNA polymerases I and III subunit RPAC2 [Frankliniella fusca]